MKPIHHIASIHQLHQAVGGEPPRHPLFSIHRLEDLPNSGPAFPERFTYGFYSIGLKKNLSGYVKYGRTQYDFQKERWASPPPFRYCPLTGIFWKTPAAGCSFFNRTS